MQDERKATRLREFHTDDRRVINCLVISGVMLALSVAIIAVG